MADTQAKRVDIDIEADIDDMICDYPPLVKDRHHIHTDVNNGVVTVSGHTRTAITRQYLVDALAKIGGVTSVKADALYSDADVRLEVGRLIPVGVYVVMDYGVVVLAGSLPEGVIEATLISSVKAVPGVRAVRTGFTS